MQVDIRGETVEDYDQIAEVIEAAFRDEPFSDHQEHRLVERLRQSDAFVPELSLVAETRQQIVGHILLTPLKIRQGNHSFNSLALAPVSVRPDFQRKGIGSQLIQEAHRKARGMGYTSVIVLGHEKYYPRFGYKPTRTYAIELPFEAPEENCMILALTDDGLDGVSGKVEYPRAFFS